MWRALFYCATFKTWPHCSVCSFFKCEIDEFQFICAGVNFACSIKPFSSIVRSNRIVSISCISFLFHACLHLNFLLSRHSNQPSRIYTHGMAIFFLSPKIHLNFTISLNECVYRNNKSSFGLHMCVFLSMNFVFGCFIDDIELIGVA